MADSPQPRRRYSSSPSPAREKESERSRSRSPRRSDRSDRNDRGGDKSDRSDRTRDRSSERSRKSKPDSSNPGNNLYITGLSTRVNEKDLEEHFSREGKVLECRLVLDPRTRESRGFGFVTMERLEDAERCIKYLNRSTLEGRMITVEKAKRKRARTPTPGEYLGVRAVPSRRGGGRSGGFHRDGRSQRHSPEYLPYGGSRDRSPRYSPYRSQRDRSQSPQYAPYRR